MKLEDKLIKKPFLRRNRDDGYYSKEVINQSVFLNEYDVYGHKIFDRRYFSDRIKKNDKGETYIHFVERRAFPFQKIIRIKQTIHLTGNPISIESISSKDNDFDNDVPHLIRQGWITKNMDVAFSEAVKEEKTVGDVAFCAVINRNGDFSYRIFSYKEGDKLYPHFDNDGKRLIELIRVFKTYEGEREVEIAEVYGEKTVKEYRRKDDHKFKRIKGLLNINDSDWDLVDEKVHGFNRCPCVYKRSDGPAWNDVQPSIDAFEKSASNLGENNKAYAFRIMFISGDDIDVLTDDSGQPSVVYGEKGSEANFLDKADASDTFKMELELLLKQIFMGSFTVLPPELKSGDTPVATIKLAFSPALEKAMEDAKEWDLFVDEMFDLFVYGYAKELGKTIDFSNVSMRASIVPYVHQNETEIIKKINDSLLYGSISSKTATEKHPYSAPDEFNRKTKEDKSEGVGIVNDPYSN